MAYNPQISAIEEITLPNNCSFVNGNNGIVMSMDNEIMFCDNIEYSGAYIKNTTFLTLPISNMLPLYPLSFVIPVITGNGIQLENCQVDTSGNLSVNNSFYDPIFNIAGLILNINGKFFSPSLDNLSGYTSPLDLY